MIILASQSPRRKQLLEQASLTFKILVADTDESFDKQTPIAQIPIDIARQKAIAVIPKTNEGDIIIAADTIVHLHGEIIGKPTNHEHAKDILQKLSGKKHEVITGVYVCQNDKSYSFSDSTDVYFNTLSEAQIEYYVTNFKPFDKAGAYAIQEWIGVIGIQKIDGCFYNVMGLPVSKLLSVLEKEFNFTS